MWFVSESGYGVSLTKSILFYITPELRTELRVEDSPCDERYIVLSGSMSH